jgi:hypothetical protein
MTGRMIHNGRIRNLSRWSPDPRAEGAPEKDTLFFREAPPVGFDC